MADNADKPACLVLLVHGQQCEHWMQHQHLLAVARVLYVQW
jgi:hypothetical protein